MMGRGIMWKQATFTFYRPAALTLAATLADAPFSCVQIFIFCVIIYFMAGLALSAGAFFSVSWDSATVVQWRRSAEAKLLRDFLSSTSSSWHASSRSPRSSVSSVPSAPGELTRDAVQFSAEPS